MAGRTAADSGAAVPGRVCGGGGVRGTRRPLGAEADQEIPQAVRGGGGVKAELEMVAQPHGELRPQVVITPDSSLEAQILEHVWSMWDAQYHDESRTLVLTATRSLTNASGT